MPRELNQRAEVVSVSDVVRRAAEGRYAESQAERYRMGRAAFCAMVEAALRRHCAESTSDQLNMLKTLHVEELVLARACTHGNETAWSDFLERYRSGLYAAASAIARDEAAGRELADGLYADLWGMTERDGKRISKLDYYTGRGSLAGWLRTVLAQRQIDQLRSRAKNVSLEERMEAGAHFVAPDTAPAAEPDGRVALAVEGALAQSANEDRLLLAAYFLDRRTLAEIGKMMGVHESTASRRLERATTTIRKQVRRRLLAVGMTQRQCDEALEEIDVRDLHVAIRENLQQEMRDETI